LAGCTADNWRGLLGVDERWIDERESTLNPMARNGQYWGLGQLGPSYPWSSDPCVQIVDQRDYMTKRYGSWANARAHWEGYGWW
jgi:hypothetical protein